MSGSVKYVCPTERSGFVLTPGSSVCDYLVAWTNGDDHSVRNVRSAPALLIVRWRTLILVNSSPLSHFDQAICRNVTEWDPVRGWNVERVHRSPAPSGMAAERGEPIWANLSQCCQFLSGSVPRSPSVFVLTPSAPDELTHNAALQSPPIPAVSVLLCPLPSRNQPAGRRLHLVEQRALAISASGK